MFATPAAVLGVWFRGVLAVGIVVGGILLIRAWYRELPPAPQSIPQVVTREVPADQPEGNRTRTNQTETVRVEEGQRSDTMTARVLAWRPGLDKPTAMLAGGVLLLLLSVGGRWIGPWLLLPAGTGRGPVLGDGQVHHITRPDGTLLHVEVHGSATAPTVILTHGWGMNREEWAYLKQAWKERFRLVVWDLPGLGKSSRPPNRDFSMEKLAGDLDAVVEFSGSRPVVLIGHSIGGMITQTFCRRFPEKLGTRVSGAILVHTTYINPLRTMSLAGLYTALQKPLVEPLLYLQIGLSPLVWISTWMSYRNGSIHWSIMKNGFGGSETREKLEFVAAFQPLGSPAVIARGALGMLRLDEAATLPKLPIPVLAMAAENDPITLAEASRHICSTAPHGRLRTLLKTKHFGLIEFDAEFAQAAAEFCESVFRY